MTPVTVSRHHGRLVESESEANLFFLKYASAKSVLEVIREIYADLDFRVAVDDRLNAVIVFGEPKGIRKIEQLIEALDRNAGPKRKDKSSAGASTRNDPSHPGG